MPPTDPIPGRAALWRPACLALALACAPVIAGAQGKGWAVAPPVQETARVTDADVIGWIDAGMAHLRDGDLDAAYDLFRLAEDNSEDSDDFSLPVFFLSNLAMARLYMTEESWEELSIYAASVATGMDVDGYRDHPYRIEAMTFQGLVAYRDDRLNEADLILRAAYGATEGREDLAMVRDLALFYLALTAYHLGAPDAEPLRRAYFDQLFGLGGWVTGREIAFLYYMDVLELRSQGMAPDEMVQFYSEFVDGLAASGDGIPPVEMSLYRGLLGLLNSDAGNHQAAFALFRERHAYLLENGPYDDDFLFSAQQVVVTQANLGDPGAAYEFLQENIAFAREVGLVSEVYAVLERELGTLQQELGHPDLAQEHFRQAYALLRESRRLTDPEVVALRDLIDTADPGIAGFAFADELRSPGVAPLQLADDGGTLLAQFFEGGYLLAGERLVELDGLRDPDADDPVALLNWALLFALAGLQDAALDDLAAARATMPDQADLVELVARVWGADAAPELAKPAIDRLEARIDRLSPAQRSAYLALAAFQALRLQDETRARSLIERWQQVAAAQPDRGDPWHRFAGAIIVDAATLVLLPDRADAIWQAFQRDMDSLPPLPLLRDYARLMHLAYAPDGLAAPGAVVELSGLLRRFRERLPPYHILVFITEYNLSNAFEWQGDMEQALTWMDRTATTLRAQPSPNIDTLAFALSEQARLMLMLGRVDQATLIAREAYEMIDTRTSRAGFAGRIVGTFADALFQRTEDHDRVAALYARHLGDPAYADRIAPETRAQQLMAYSSLMAENGTWDQVRDALDEAEAILVRDDGFDRRGFLAQLHFNRAVAEYRFDVGDYGFARIRRSNDIAAALRDGLAASGRATGVLAEALLNQATWTALIGWDYAQTLPE